MTPNPICLSGTPEELTLKAFYLALARYESSLPPEAIAEINAVAAAVNEGNIQAIAQLSDLAKSYAEFNEVYDNAYLDLLELDAAIENEQDQWLPSDEELPDVPETLGILGNLLAPNPWELAKRDRRSYGEKFLEWLSKMKIAIGRRG